MGMLLRRHEKAKPEREKPKKPKPEPAPTPEENWIRQNESWV